MGKQHNRWEEIHVEVFRLSCPLKQWADGHMLLIIISVCEWRFEEVKYRDCSSVANSSFGARVYLITLYLVPVVSSSSSSLPPQFMQY